MTEKRILEIETLERKELDAEWIELILEAKKLGINLEGIRDFIEKNAIR